jgi:tetratricopeptide (TPR) repeat protein
MTTATMPPAALDEVPFDERFEALIEEGRVLFEAERLEETVRVFQEAEKLAEEMGDPLAVDRAFTNRCGVLMVLERGLSPEMLQRLREILMAGDDAVNSRLAAYNIARTFEFTREHRKGLFYARIALDRSQVLGSADWLASSHNQIGNFLLGESHFEEAGEEYKKALSLLADEVPSIRRAKIYDNLGYALVILGHFAEGLALLYRSLRMVRGLKARREQIFPHLDLCFALLEVGRFRDALRHGVRALALAEEAEEGDSIKHALFLLGEAAQQAGDAVGARQAFERLQKRYFPEASYLPEVLLTIDVRKLINLKA